MKKRLLVTAGMLAILLGVVLVVLWLLPARPAVTKSNFDGIETGMTLSQVEEILGADKGSRLILIDIMLPIGHEQEAWGGDDGIAWIIFDERRRVVSKDWEDSPLPMMERLRRRIPWIRL